MTSRRLAMCLVAVSAFSIAQEAFAQGRQIRRSRPSHRQTLSRPPVSPYLNLLRPELDPATNYYTLVRPAIEQRAATFQQGEALQQLRSRVDEQAASPFAGANAGLAPTGSGARFMNLSHYYPGFGGGRGGVVKR